MSVVTGFLLTWASVSLKDRQLANVALDKQKKILTALDLFNDNSLEREAIMSLYASTVKDLFLTSAGDLVSQASSENDLPIYVVYENDAIIKYVVPFEAFGLWSTIKGYFGLDGNGKSVIGFTVYDHAETPGLGAEVEKSWFAEQFIGKEIVNSDNQFVSIGVVKGGVKGKFNETQAKNYIDAISGSTITSKGLERDLKKELAKYELFSAKLREGASE